MVAAAGGVGGAGERRPEHDRVGAARDGLDDVAGRADPTVGDDVHVAAAGLVEVVAPRGCDVGDGRGHRGVDAEGGARRVRRAAAEADEDTGRAGAHEVQGRRVGRGAADDDGHVELVDEALEVERLGATGDVLGRDRRAADDEEVDAGVDDGLPVLLGALRRQGAGDGDPGLTQLAQPLGDELGLDRLGVDLLHPRRRGLGLDLGDLTQLRASGPRSGSTGPRGRARGRAPSLPSTMALSGETTESIGAAMTGMSKW